MYPGRGTGSGAKIKTSNLFAQVSSNYNTGIKTELLLWILCCVSALLFLITAVIMEDINLFWKLHKINSIRTVWVFMFLFCIGSGILMALRLRGINIIYGNVVYLFIMLMPFYSKEKYLFQVFGGYDSGAVITVNIFFVLAIIASLATITCIVIDTFTRIKIKFVIMILSIVTMGLTACMVFFPYLFSSGFPSEFGKLHFVIGSFSYFIIFSVTGVYTILYCKGIIDNNEKMFARFNNPVIKEKIRYQNHYVPGSRQQKADNVNIQCISGNLQGQTFNCNGDIIIGSRQGSANVVISDPYVSAQHCFIRFNQAGSFYEVLDLSSNGTYFTNGIRLQSNVYTACPKGTVLYIGSINQQFKLL